MLAYLLQETIFKGYQSYAATYGDAITLLISLTVVYLILYFVSATKKSVKIILIIGWGLLLITLIASATSA